MRAHFHFQAFQAIKAATANIETDNNLPNSFQPAHGLSFIIAFFFFLQ